MAAIAATPGLGFELELTLGQVDFVNGPIPEYPISQNAPNKCHS